MDDDLLDLHRDLVLVMKWQVMRLTAADCVAIIMADIERKLDALQAAMTHLADVLTPALQQIVRSFADADEGYWQQYHDAGAPYGDTPEGRALWFFELEDAEEQEP